MDIFDRANQGKNLKAVKGAKGSGAVDNQMEVKEFVAGLIRLAHAKFKKLPSLADRWDAFLQDHVQAFADMGNMTDEISEMLSWPEVVAVIGDPAVANLLAQSFLNFCVSGASASSKNDPTANTMDMPEYMKFLQAAELLDQSLTVREARAIFVQVNLDDDMYVQEDSANNSSELVLDEFVECLVRIAFEKEPLKKLSDFKDGVPTEQHLRQGSRAREMVVPGERSGRSARRSLDFFDEVGCEPRYVGSQERAWRLM